MLAPDQRDWEDRIQTALHDSVDAYVAPNFEAYLGVGLGSLAPVLTKTLDKACRGRAAALFVLACHGNELGNIEDLNDGQQ